MRLMQAFADFFQYTSTAESLAILKEYPDGLSAEMVAVMTAAKSQWLMRELLDQPWFQDGIINIETDLVSLAADLRLGIKTFSIILADAQAKPWYQDGLDATEEELLKGIFLFGQGNRPNQAIALLSAVDQGLYRIDRVSLPSGEKGVLVVSSTAKGASQLSSAAALVQRYAGEVEKVAGAYKARYFLALLTELDPGLCGTATPAYGTLGLYEELPGLVRLQPSCVTARTTVHELAHVFVGLGPTWFTEGVADLIAMRITGLNGNYFSRSATGQIELDMRYVVNTPPYYNQGALGAQLLVAVNALIGPDAMNEAIREIAAKPRQRSGQQILDAIAAHAPEEKKERLEALFKARIDYTK